MPYPYQSSITNEMIEAALGVSKTAVPAATDGNEWIAHVRDLTDLIVRLDAAIDEFKAEISAKNTRNKTMSDQEQELTQIEQDALAVFKEKYIEHGYAFSGCVAANSDVLARLSGVGDELWAAIDHLIQLGLVQRRNCQALAFELTATQRLELIESHDLSDYWQLAGSGPGGDEYAEILHVRSVIEKGRSNV